MKPYWDNGPVQLYQADARSIPLPDHSVHCVVTSPPYFGLRVYKDNDDRGIGLEASVEAYIANLVDVFREVRRVLRDDGVLWINLGDSYAHDGPSGGSSPDGPRKGREATNEGQQNYAIPRGLKAGDRLGIPERVVLALQADGWVWRDTIIWAKKSAMPESLAGWRWERCRVKTGLIVPMKFRHASYLDNSPMPNPIDKTIPGNQMAEWSACPGCPKCANNDGLVLRKGSWRTTSSHEYIYMLTKKMSYYSDGDAVKVQGGERVGVPSVVQGPDFDYDAIQLFNHLRSQEPTAERTWPPARMADYGSCLKVCVGLAATILNSTQLENQESLLVFNAEIRQEGFYDNYSPLIVGVPAMERLTALCVSFLAGDIPAETLCQEVEGWTIYLHNANYFGIVRALSKASFPRFVIPHRDGTVSINDTSQVSQFESVFNNHSTSIVPYVSLANRRSVWNDISPEPYGGAHFATFPSDLPRICIQASTSERGCCAECGSQWARVVSHETAIPQRDGEWKQSGDPQRNDVERKGGFYDATQETLGWRSSCGHNAPAIPATVLDPFSGTGTTCRAAQKLGRRAVGVDISESYLEQAVRRLSAVTLPMGI